MPENAPTTPTAPTLNEQEKKSDRIYRFIISALCFAMCTVQIVNVIYPFFISSEFFVIHFMFGMLMCYLVYDYKGKKRYFYSPAKIFDIILALGVAAVAIYILRDIDAFLLRKTFVPTADHLTGTKRKVKRLAARNTRIEHRAVGEFARVMHCDARAFFCFGAVADHDVGNLKRFGHILVSVV